MTGCPAVSVFVYMMRVCESRSNSREDVRSSARDAVVCPAEFRTFIKSTGAESGPGQECGGKNREV